MIAKVLAIAILAVLLTGSATSLAGQQLGWLADPRTGCRVWNPYPEPNETITWSGQCQNGFAQGHGVLQWFQDNRPSGRSEGEWRDGKRNGHGVSTWVDGN